MDKGRYAALVFAGGACYGILSTIVKLAYAAGLQHPEVVGAQIVFGTLLLWGLVLLARVPLRISLQDALLSMLLGVPSGLTSLLYYKSLTTLSASMAVIFLFQFVWMGTAADVLLHRRLPDGRKSIAVVLLIIGSALAAGVVGAELPAGEGIFWGMLSALAYTAFIVGSGKAPQAVPPLLRSAFMSTGAMLAVCLVIPPVFLADAGRVIELLPYGLPLGFLGMTLPPLLFSVGMPHVGPSLGAILTSVELPCALLSAAVILGEAIRGEQWIGILLLAAGIILGNLPKREKEARDGSH